MASPTTGPAPAPETPAGSSPSAAAGPRKRLLRNYLLDRSLQLRYTLLVTTLSTVITGTLGYLVWNQAHYATRKVGEALADFGDPALTAWVLSDLQRGDKGLVLMMVGVGVGLILILGLYLILMTHKVAGPLYKIGHYFDDIRDGRLPTVVDLRKGDQLQDFFLRFKDMNDAVRARVADEIAAVDRFLAACEKAEVPASGELGHALDELRALRKLKEKALAG